MKIKLKLFATIMHYLPDDADGHEVMLDVDPSSSAYDIIDSFGIDRCEAYLVLCDGVYLHEHERVEPLKEGVTIAVWPPVAGG